jgi:hypothetical protein
MIFTATPISKKNIIVRFFYYSDPNRGYGDAGTARYMNISIDKFECQVGVDFNNKPYYCYTLNDDTREKILFNHKWYGRIGYEQSTAKQQRKELCEVQERIEQLSHTNEYK